MAARRSRMVARASDLVGRRCMGILLAFAIWNPHQVALGTTHPLPAITPGTPLDRDALSA